MLLGLDCYQDILCPSWPGQGTRSPSTPARRPSASRPARPSPWCRWWRSQTWGGRVRGRCTSVWPTARPVTAHWYRASPFRSYVSRTVEDSRVWFYSFDFHFLSGAQSWEVRGVGRRCNMPLFLSAMRFPFNALTLSQRLIFLSAVQLYYDTMQINIKKEIEFSDFKLKTNFQHNDTTSPEHR